jgi:hypothetical protein
MLSRGKRMQARESTNEFFNNALLFTTPMFPPKSRDNAHCRSLKMEAKVLHVGILSFAFNDYAQDAFAQSSAQSCANWKDKMFLPEKDRMKIG